MNYKGIKFTNTNGILMIIVNDETCYRNGWLCYWRPGGGWETLRVATKEDRLEAAEFQKKQAEKIKKKNSRLEMSNKELMKEMGWHV